MSKSKPVSQIKDPSERRYVCEHGLIKPVGNSKVADLNSVLRDKYFTEQNATPISVGTPIYEFREQLIRFMVEHEIWVYSDLTDENIVECKYDLLEYIIVKMRNKEGCLRFMAEVESYRNIDPRVHDVISAVANMFSLLSAVQVDEIVHIIED